MESMVDQAVQPKSAPGNAPANSASPANPNGAAATGLDSMVDQAAAEHNNNNNNAGGNPAGTPPVKPGFVSTVASDAGQIVKGLFELPAKTIAYGIAGQPHDDVAAQLAAQQEAHKKAVYNQFKQDFHSGQYGKAFSGLVDLFNPNYDDPNDPLDQVMSAQWKSSGDAKQKMLEAAKKGDTLGVVQHAAGIIPIASQVDAAMDRYREEPTRENLAHIVTSAIPAFVPSMLRGAAKAAPVVSRAVAPVVDAVRDTVSPSSEAEVAGTPKPGIVKQVIQGKRVAQPGAQSAVRSGVQASADVTPSVPKLVMEDTNPPSLTVDEGGNPISADGQHRAALLVKAGQGDEPFTIKYTDAAGNTSDQTVTANQFLKRLNRTPEDILKTDAQQTAVRAGNGEPRQAVTRPVARPAEAEPTPAANPTEPLLQGNKTIVDAHIDRIAKAEKTAYKNMDDVAGFDVKAEKAQLANDQYKLKQLGNTDADVTQRGNLIDSINDSTDRIAEAEAKMKEAGVDPDLADNIHRQRMAAQDFKKALVKRTNADGSVNVDGLLADSKNLRFTKYGDRLEQFMGKDAAEAYMSKLQEAQKLGAHAIKAQQVAKWIGGLAGLGVLGEGVRIAHAVTQP